MSRSYISSPPKRLHMYAVGLLYLFISLYLKEIEYIHNLYKSPSFPIPCLVNSIIDRRVIADLSTQPIRSDSCGLLRHRLGRDIILRHDFFIQLHPHGRIVVNFSVAVTLACTYKALLFIPTIAKHIID
jgi:hypothetical protein